MEDIFDQPEKSSKRPPVFLKNRAYYNVLMKPGISPEKRRIILNQLPPRSRHKWFGSMKSSQALAQSVFANLKEYEKLHYLEEIECDHGDPLFENGKIIKDNFFMNPEKNDAAVYGPDGLVANAKIFLGEDGQFIHGASVTDCNDEQIYVIADPCYNLVFFAKGHHPPFGFADNLQAVTTLGRMRKDHDIHLKLYRVEPVNSPVASKTELEQYHKDRDIKNFEYSLIDEYLN